MELIQTHPFATFYLLGGAATGLNVLRSFLRRNPRQPDFLQSVTALIVGTTLWPLFVIPSVSIVFRGSEATVIIAPNDVIRV